MSDHARLSRIDTMWSVVRRAHGKDANSVFDAQQKLLERYGGAIRRYLLASLRDEDAADEVFQEFALRFVRGDFRSAQPERGRFRSFVKTVVYNLIMDHHRRRKRGQREQELQPDAAPEVDTPSADNDKTFLQSWRDELLSRSWNALQAIEVDSGKPYFTVLKCRVENPKLRSGELADELTARLDKAMTSGNTRVVLHRARELFSELLLSEVRESLTDPTREALEQELIDLNLFEYCRASLAKQSDDESS